MYTMLPGVTNKFCQPAPDTTIPGMLGSDIVVFILGGSERVNKITNLFHMH